MTSQVAVHDSGSVKMEEEASFLRLGIALRRPCRVARIRRPLKAKPVLSIMYLGNTADLHSRLWTGSLLVYLVPDNVSTVLVPYMSGFL